MINKLYPKTKELDNLLKNIVKIKTNGPRAFRTTPKIAEQLSKYKSIRYLSRKDYVDITTHRRKTKRSIVYFSQDLKIKPYKNNGYIFEF